MHHFLQQSAAVVGAGLFIFSAVMLMKPSLPTNPLTDDVVVETRPGENKPKVDLKVRIVIDPGHGGEDGGTAPRGVGVLEKTMTLDLAQRLKRKLEGGNYEVVLTRNGDENPKLDRRVFLANRYRKCYFVSLHFNADGASASSHGIETFYADPKSPAAGRRIRKQLNLSTAGELVDNRSKVFAEFVQKRLIESLGARDRGAKNQNFVVIRDTLGPSILVEGGFLTNSRERDRIKNSSHREKMAEAIARGIRDYLEFTENDPDHGVSIKQEFPTVPVVGPSATD